jgi:hypothetical protein
MPLVGTNPCDRRAIAELCGGSILGVPMRPEEIEELMSCTNKPNVEVAVDEENVEDNLIRHILGQMR